MRSGMAPLTAGALLATGLAAFLCINHGEGELETDIGYFGPGNERSLPVAPKPSLSPPVVGVPVVAGTVIQTVVPIGSVVAWLKSYTNTPDLSVHWVECNGQTLNLPGSPYHGAVIPNLNGAGNQAKRFLRGSLETGDTGGAENHNHGLFLIRRPEKGGQVNVSAALSAPNLPPYYEVTWIMRVL